MSALASFSLQASSSNGTGSDQNGVLPPAQTHSAAGLETKAADQVSEGYQASSNGARPDVDRSTERGHSSGRGTTRIADTTSSKSAVSLQQRKTEKV